MSAPSFRDRLAVRVFWLSSVLLALGYGVVAGIRQWFPHDLFASAMQGFDVVSGGEPQWYYKPVRTPSPPPILNTGNAAPGINLVTRIGRDELAVDVIDLDGKVLHHWSIDWFRMWPEARHVPDRLAPRSPPGTHVDGAALLPNGDLVFNFEHLGLLRLARDGQVVWRLPYQTHHSVRLGDDGNLWVCGQKERTAAMPGFPNLVPPFVEDIVLVVTPEGRIAREWSVPELLLQSGRMGILCLGGQDSFATVASGDVTHLNHVEPFPAAMKPGAFGPGDVLVSLRNVNTVFVFAAATGRIGFCCTGLFVRQHDPHFRDGNTISVFDNNTVGPAGTRSQSRIVLVSAPDQRATVYFPTTADNPFFTPILGRHQWLADGHLLVTDSCAGRAFEIDRNLQVVWWFIHYVEPGVVGAVEQVQRLPAAVAARFR